MILFALRSTLSNLNIATPIFQYLLFALHIHFPIFYSNLIMCLYLKCISLRQYVFQPHFLIQSINFWISVGVFSLFAFNIIIDIVWFRTIILLFVFYSFFPDFLDFFWLNPIFYYFTLILVLEIPLYYSVRLALGIIICSLNHVIVP